LVVGDNTNNGVKNGIYAGIPGIINILQQSFMKQEKIIGDFLLISQINYFWLLVTTPTTA